MDSQKLEINELINFDNNNSLFEEQPNEIKIEETLNNIFLSHLDNFSLSLNENKQQLTSRKQSFEETTFGNSSEGNSFNSKPKIASLKLFICICGKVYKSKENQVLHYKNIHLNVKPYKCSFCSSRFSHRNGKTYHERKFHTLILPYVCPKKDCI